VQAATVKIQVHVDNETDSDSIVTVKNQIFELGVNGVKRKNHSSAKKSGADVRSVRKIRRCFYQEILDFKNRLTGDGMNEFDPTLLPSPEPDRIGAVISDDLDRPDKSRYEKDRNQDNRKGQRS